MDTSIGSGTTGSFVGYRVQEMLAGFGANTAVGRTSSASGSFALQGATITAAKITADLTGLQSDDARRDGQLARRGLESSTYPTATFVLGQPVDLDSIPSEGQIAKVQATGQLTLHGQAGPCENADHQHHDTSLARPTTSTQVTRTNRAARFVPAPGQPPFPLGAARPQRWPEWFGR